MAKPQASDRRDRRLAARVQEQGEVLEHLLARPTRWGQFGDWVDFYVGYRDALDPSRPLDDLVEAPADLQPRLRARLLTLRLRDGVDPPRGRILRGVDALVSQSPAYTGSDAAKNAIEARRRLRRRYHAKSIGGLGARLLRLVPAWSVVVFIASAAWGSAGAKLVASLVGLVRPGELAVVDYVSQPVRRFDLQLHPRDAVSSIWVSKFATDSIRSLVDDACRAEMMGGEEKMTDRCVTQWLGAIAVLGTAEEQELKAVDTIVRDLHDCAVKGVLSPDFSPRLTFDTTDFRPKRYEPDQATGKPFAGAPNIFEQRCETAWVAATDYKKLVCDIEQKLLEVQSRLAAGISECRVQLTIMNVGKAPFVLVAPNEAPSDWTLEGGAPLAFVRGDDKLRTPLEADQRISLLFDTDTSAHGRVSRQGRELLGASVGPCAPTRTVAQMKLPTTCEPARH